MARMAWHRHYLKRNEANRRPTNYVFVDVETEQTMVDVTRPYIRHTFKLGVACAVRWRRGRDMMEQWFDFADVDLWWQWLAQWQSKKTVLWVVAHNAQFDFTMLGLWAHLESGYYATKRPGKPYHDARTNRTVVSGDWYGLLAIEGSPFHVETEGPRGRVNFTDLQNYYPCSLAEVGKTVGIVKGTWEKVRGNDVALAAYCRNDVDILKCGYMGLVQQWERERNGNWQFSAAGLAYSHYRHKYLKDAVAIHSHDGALRLEWAALYGGECRCWYRGRVDGGLVHYDVNSLYPSVMQDQVYPTALVDVILKPRRSQFRWLTDKYACVADVDIATSTDHYPVRCGGKIVYPIGKFRTILAGPELLEALDSGHITDCHELALYTYAAIFKSYVLDWWSRKQIAHRKGDTAAEAFAKLMLNSLPAKFAQRTPSWEIESRVDVVRPWKSFPWRDPDTGTIYPARSVGWIGQVCRQRVATEHSFPAIYAYVTSYARVKMRELRKHVPPLQLYYQDTDSLIIGSECVDGGYIPIDTIGDGLGQIREVGRYSYGVFRGPKNYTVDGRHIIAGVRRSDVELAPMVWSGTRFERATHLFGRGPDGTLREHSVDLDTPGSDSEGSVRPDGFTRPLILPDGLPNDVLCRIVEDGNGRRNR